MTFCKRLDKRKKFKSAVSRRSVGFSQVSGEIYLYLPVYDDNGRCQGGKKRTGVWRWKRSQGRPLLAFSLTLDGVSSAPTIERGWKRSAFAFCGASNLSWKGFAFAFDFCAHDQELAVLLKPLSVDSTNHLFGQNGDHDS